MWPSATKRDFTAVGIGAESGYDNNKTRRKQSCWRAWNRLSSLQRSIVCLILILGTVSAIYVLPTLYHDFVSMDELDSLSRKRHKGGDAFNQDGFHGDLVKSPPAGVLHPKDLNQNKLDVNKPRKRGPPQLKPRAPEVKDENKVNNNDNLPVDQIVQPNRDKNAPLIFTGPKNSRQKAVVAAFRHSWAAYKKYAWGHDELRPLTKSNSEWFGLGLTLVDSLDTMYIMGLTEEFKEARDWVENSLSLDVDRDVNLFEVTIRILGGLLSTYHLSGDEIFKKKAIELGDRLMPAFRTGSPIPYSDVNLHRGTAHAPRWGPDSSTSEVTTIQLEFKDLSKITGNSKYEKAADKVMDHIYKQPKKDGLVPLFINANTGFFRAGATITLGARADSYYEYLVKQWIQTGKKNERVKSEYVSAVEGMKKHLMRQSEPNKYTFFGELLSGHSFSPKMDELVCYLAGSLALGAHHGLDREHLEIGKKLGHTCYQMYARMPTNLAPEIAYFNMIPGAPNDIIVKPADSHNLQRPESIESLFYLYRITKDKKYKDWGWMIFQAFEKYTKLPEGYTSINNVKSASNPGYRNKMESFWLGETLKYFYLLFSDEELIPLDRFVFNTEAHPLPIYDH